MTARARPATFLPEAEPSIAELVSGIFDDARLLVRKEIELARLEVRGELERARAAVAVLAFGASLLAFAAMALLTAGILGLVAAGVPAWVSALAIGGVLAIVGGVLTRTGLRRLSAVHPIQRAVDAVRGEP